MYMSCSTLSDAAPDQRAWGDHAGRTNSLTTLPNSLQLADGARFRATNYGDPGNQATAPFQQVVDILVDKAVASGLKAPITDSNHCNCLHDSVMSITGSNDSYEATRDQTSLAVAGIQPGEKGGQP
jgi:hypothetical protein